MYEAMKAAFLQVLPRTPPGLTYDELGAAVLPLLPEALFPGGAKAGWYTKAVQLDLEAKGIIGRARTRPLRLQWAGVSARRSSARGPHARVARRVHLRTLPLAEQERLQRARRQHDR